MAVFNLEEREKQGVWFGMEGGGRVQLKVLSRDEWRAILARTVTRTPEYAKLDGKWERFEVNKVDEELQNELFWDALIVAWEGLFDGKGAEIPCTKETKALLMLTQPAFAKFVGECIDALAKGEAARAEALEKN